MNALDNRKRVNHVTLGQKLRYFRMTEHYSQKQIADMLSMERSTYTYYECDKSLPSVYTLFHIARLYGVGMELFVDERIEPFCGKADAGKENRRKPKSI